MIYIDYQDSRPIYEQIVERYKLLILKGAIAPDEQMPSVRNLAMELSTNPKSVQKAYAELERQGFLYTMKGVGNFVCANDALKTNRMEELVLQMKELMNEASEIGISKEEIWKRLQ